jgi:hypothetical protein
LIPKDTLTTIHTSPPRATLDWRQLHALGLPEGSVRALLAILICATIWGLLLLRPDRELPDFLRDLLFIIMGHYFAARRRASEVEEPGPPPLFLPRGSVRLVLVAGFIAVAVVLFRRGQLTAIDQYPGAVTLILVAGFLLGVVMSAVSRWWRERGHRTPRLVEDLRALVSLAAAFVLVALAWDQLFSFLPRPGIDALGAARLRLGK